MYLFGTTSRSKYQPQIFIIIRKHFAYRILRPVSFRCAKGLEMQIRRPQSPSTSSHRTLEEIFSLLWNQNIHIRVHKRLTVIRTRSHKQIYIFNFYLFNMHFNIILPSTPRFLYELHDCNIVRIFQPFTCPVRSANTILFNLITSVRYTILIETVKGRKHLVALEIDNRIILKLV